MKPAENSHFLTTGTPGTPGTPLFHQCLSDEEKARAERARQGAAAYGAWLAAGGDDTPALSAAEWAALDDVQQTLDIIHGQRASGVPVALRDGRIMHSWRIDVAAPLAAPSDLLEAIANARKAGAVLTINGIWLHCTEPADRLAQSVLRRLQRNTAAVVACLRNEEGTRHAA